MCVKFWVVRIKKESLAVAVNNNKWDRTFRKVNTWGSAPEVKAVVLSFLAISKRMTRSVVVVFMGDAV
jgi:hypothetical protein